MIDWLIANIGTILVGLAVLAVVVFVIALKVRDKKKGKSSCGCGCESCAMAGKCHSAKSDQE
ncbi:MAG: FeoB-associated Cys-rich membrane protein [Clostridia bacterium]|nr:FeoB-associated Cys-rich membrane protein [Clostridia bacterium]